VGLPGGSNVTTGEMITRRFRRSVDASEIRVIVP
jgi:hypothetical protein